LRQRLRGNQLQGVFTTSTGCKFKYGPWKSESSYGLIIPLEGTINQDAVLEVSKFMMELEYSKIFTSPLTPEEKSQFIEFGYMVEETLILMKRSFDIPLQTKDRKKLSTHKFRKKDLSEILKVDHASFDTFWRFDENAFLNAKKATPYVRIRVIRKNNQIAGYAITGAGVKEGFIQRLAIFPDHQNCGFGTLLLNDGLDWLHRKGVSNVWVNTQPTNQVAINLYKKTKFEISKDELSVLRFSSGMQM
jgi:ribosomal protein S18 acetylase RimI-like enzyme